MKNSDDETTYEDYLKAKKYARWKYKYGLFVLILCWICLLLLVYYTWHYGKELSTHPAIYMVKALDVDYCYCYGDIQNYYINRTSISFSNGFFP